MRARSGEGDDDCLNSQTHVRMPLHMRVVLEANASSKSVWHVAFDLVRVFCGF